MSNGNGAQVQNQKGDRWIVFAQLAFGTALVMTGGFLAAYAGAASNVAVALIGVGATLLPPGAAAAANARILSKLPEATPVAAGPSAGPASAAGDADTPPASSTPGI